MAGSHNSKLQDELGRVCVLGCGITGKAVVDVLLTHGVRPVICDDRLSAELSMWAIERELELLSPPDHLQSGDASDLQLWWQDTLKDIDVVFPAPGLGDIHIALKAATVVGCQICSEFDLAQRLDSRPHIAITATDGKTTVVTLVTRMLNRSRIKAVAVGNTDIPVVKAIEDPSVDVFVVEASSFRLAHSADYSAQVGVWLNFGEDHLDAHRDMASYELAKAKIFSSVMPGGLLVANLNDPVVYAHAQRSVYGSRATQNATDTGSFCGKSASSDVALREVTLSEVTLSEVARSDAASEQSSCKEVPSDNPCCKHDRKEQDLARPLLGVFSSKTLSVDVSELGVDLCAVLEGDELVIYDNRSPNTQVPTRTVICARSQMSRKLSHDVANVLAASLAALQMGARIEDVRSTAIEFDGLEHRAEHVARIGCVDYVNDSKATTPHATAAALAAFESVVLIAGGRNKGLSFEPLLAESERIRLVIGLGEAGPKVVDVFKDTNEVAVAATMEDAVGIASQRAQADDVVLLSPACASYDAYRSYRHRGEHFKEIVKTLDK